MTSLVINVVGTPAPQGSHRAFVVKGRPVVTQDNKRTKPWRADVVAAIETFLDRDHIPVAGPNGGVAWGPELRGNLPLTMPLAVEVTFYIARPGYHFRTGKNAGQLKPGAPVYVDKKPDGDKLLRSTLDALTTSGLIRDDAQLVDIRGIKRYADAATGARITITPLNTVRAAAPSAADTDPNPREEALF